MLSLDGEWKLAIEANPREASKPDFDDASWKTVKVPGHFQEQGIKAEKVVLRKEFTLEPKDGKTCWLIIKGAFYKGEVWVNGEKVGEWEGYFYPEKFRFKPSVKNAVAIVLESKEERDINAKEQVAGVFYHWDCRDPTFNPIGIWGGVEVVEKGPVWFERVRIIPKLSDESAKVKLVFWLGSDAERDVKLRIKIAPHNFEGEVIEKDVDAKVLKGVTVIEYEVEIKEPKLWWTWDLGEQNIYELSAEVLVGTETSDAVKERFGIREVKLEKGKGGWRLYLNGRRLFARGTNYPPSDQRLANATAEDIRRDIKMMKEMNSNMVRVHAHVDRKELYEIADEEGILIWQDMPLQWMYSKKVKKAAVENARKMVRFLENHPSVAIWCAHNEPFNFPNAKSVTLGIIQLIIAGLFSWLLGTWKYIGQHKPPVDISIPVWDQIVAFLAQPLIPGFKYLTYGSAFGVLIALIAVLPALAHMFGGYEGLILTVILGLFLPWDLLLVFTLLGMVIGNPITALFWNWNKDVLDKELVKVIREEDMDSRPVVPQSGMYGWLGGGTDLHIYDGWYSAFHIPNFGPFKEIRGYRHAKYLKTRLFRRIPRFITEYGAQAFPSPENFLRLLREGVERNAEFIKKKFGDEFLRELREASNSLEDVWKRWKVVEKYLKEFHQYQPQFMKPWLNPKKFASLEEFIIASQKYQAKLNKFYNELWRSMKYKPCGGTLQFMFVDTAPLITWAVVDYWRRPKEAFKAVKLSFEPVYAFIDWPKTKYKVGKKYKTKLYIVNDLHRKFKYEVSAKAGGEEVYHEKGELPEDSLLEREIFLVFKEAGLQKIVIELKAESEGEQRTVVNEYEVAVV